MHCSRPTRKKECISLFKLFYVIFHESIHYLICRMPVSSESGKTYNKLTLRRNAAACYLNVFSLKLKVVYGKGFSFMDIITIRHVTSRVNCAAWFQTGLLWVLHVISVALFHPQKPRV